MWDTTTEFGQRVERRLAEELVIWLVTTNSQGAPQPSPVWFIREGNELLIYSKPDAPKVRNIRERPLVALHFNSDAKGDNLMIFQGTAQIDAAAPRAHEVPAYVAKYESEFPVIGSSPEQMAAEYSAAVRVRLTKLRGW